jgi:predicted nucleic acid-binding protein
MTVVADSTPLIALASIGKLHLLQKLYQRIVIPNAVYEEVVHQGKGRSGSSEVRNAVWIQTRTVTQQPSSDQQLPSGLGRGESEAIILAKELSADLIVMDETAGRKEATRRGLRLIGTIGVLQQAKLQGLIPALKPELNGLMGHQFHLSTSTYRAILRLSCEE